MAEEVEFVLKVDSPSEGQNLDEYFQAAITKLEDVLGKVKLERDEQLALADVNFHLKQALVNQLVSQVEGDMANLYDAQNTDVHRLAYVLLPRLRLINNLRKKTAMLERVKNDPDYQRCIFQLKNTLGYLMKEAEPMLEQFTSLSSMSGLGGMTGVPYLPGMMYQGGGDDGTTTEGDVTTDTDMQGGDNDTDDTNSIITETEEDIEVEMDGGKKKRRRRSSPKRKKKRVRKARSSGRRRSSRTRSARSRRRQGFSSSTRRSASPPKRGRRRRSLVDVFGF